MIVLYTRIASPTGPLLLTSDGTHLTGVYFSSSKRPVTPESDWSEHSAPFENVTSQLGEYFEKHRRTFDIPLRPAGTDFQRTVWNALLDIPWGATISYGRLAERIGNPKAVRAVGLANGKNPISIIIPCHRVIGADGTLTGYGGGLANKRLLLELEDAWQERQGSLF